MAGGFKGRNKNMHIRITYIFICTKNISKLGGGN